MNYGILDSGGGYICPLCNTYVLGSEQHICPARRGWYGQETYGWICPRCGMVMAPFVRTCESCQPLTGSASTIENP